jgi:hypothetical protein
MSPRLLAMKLLLVAPLAGCAAAHVAACERARLAPPFCGNVYPR